jgi:plasmid replication initiation protein
MRSAYSIRLYELLKSYAGINSKDFETEELKDKLCAPYANFKDFRRKVLEVATKEINLYTDIEITWEPITKGRKVVKVHFTIKQREGWSFYKNQQRASDALDGQLKLEDYLKK